jgi:beta-fructofuranosidase
MRLEFKMKWMPGKQGFTLVGMTLLMLTALGGFSPWSEEVFAEEPKGDQKMKEENLAGSENKADLELALKQTAEDPQRPSFHATAPVYMMGDPNGSIQVHGTYHLFYQHARTRGDNPRMHWGHLRSKDLVHWEDLPIALIPDKYFHICSGSAVVDNGTVTAIFTGAEPQQQCLAIAEDPDLIKWRYYEDNPVIAAPPEGATTTGFRDPYVWREGSEWRMAVGSGTQEKGGMIPMYSSPDLRKWKYMGLLCGGTGRELFEMWECPSFFALDLASDLTPKAGSDLTLQPPLPKERGSGKYALTFNALPIPVDWARMKSMAAVGTYDGKTFKMEKTSDLDLFGEIWAPQTFRDEKGRMILFAFAWENRDGRPHGWWGCMTFPRIVSLDSSQRICFRPAEEINLLRGKESKAESLTVDSAFTPLPGDPVKGEMAEIVATFTPTSSGTFDADRFGVVVRRSPGGEEETRIYFDPKAQRIGANRLKSSLAKGVNQGEREGRGHFELAAGEPLTLHVIVDHSVLDVFANDRAAGSVRIYPTRPDSLGIGLFSEGGAVTAKSVQVWPLKP